MCWVSLKPLVSRVCIVLSLLLSYVGLSLRKLINIKNVFNFTLYIWFIVFEHNLCFAGKENVVVFDFLGKDSIRYYNEVPVEKRVFKNLTLFMENKKGEDDLFDRLNVSVFFNQHCSCYNFHLLLFHILLNLIFIYTIEQMKG